jgi:hypothetical protein
LYQPEAQNRAARRRPLFFWAALQLTALSSRKIVASLRKEKLFLHRIVPRDFAALRLV